MAVQTAAGSALARIKELRNGKRRNTGFSVLEDYTGGFQPGTLNIIAVCPLMGKTALVLNIAQFSVDVGSNNHVLQ